MIEIYDRQYRKQSQKNYKYGQYATFHRFSQVIIDLSHIYIILILYTFIKQILELLAIKY
jgi:hypothetical protein